MENIEIIPLSPENWREALAIVNSVFGDRQYSEDDDPNFWYEVSIYPEKNAELIKGRGTKYVRYYVALDKNSNKIIGTTGLYSLVSDGPKVAWVGWFCIDPVYRGRGIGKMMLKWTVDQAKKEGNSDLKLHTSTRDKFKAAQSLYDSFGFKTTEIKELEGYTILTKVLRLDEKLSHDS